MMNKYFLIETGEYKCCRIHTFELLKFLLCSSNRRDIERCQLINSLMWQFRNAFVYKRNVQECVGYNTVYTNQIQKAYIITWTRNILHEKHLQWKSETKIIYLLHEH